MRRFRLAITILVLFSPSAALSLTANEWKGLPEMPRVMYIATTLEGWRFAEAFHDIEKTSERRSLLYCWEKGMTVEQFVAMVDKHMNDHPEERHKAMEIILLKTLKQICPHQQ